MRNTRPAHTCNEREQHAYDCKPLSERGGVFVHLRKYKGFVRGFVDHGSVCRDIDPKADSDPEGRFNRFLIVSYPFFSGVY